MLLALFLFPYLRKKAGKLLKALGALMPPPRPVRPATRPVAPVGGQAAEMDTEDESSRIDTEQRPTRLVDELQEVAKRKPEDIARAIQTMMIEQ